MPSAVVWPTAPPYCSTTALTQRWHMVMISRRSSGSICGGADPRMLQTSTVTCRRSGLRGSHGHRCTITLLWAILASASSRSCGLARIGRASLDRNLTRIMEVSNRSPACMDSYGGGEMCRQRRLRRCCGGSLDIAVAGLYDGCNPLSRSPAMPPLDPCRSMLRRTLQLMPDSPSRPRFMCGGDRRRWRKRGTTRHQAALAASARVSNASTIAQYCDATDTGWGSGNSPWRRCEREERAHVLGFHDGSTTRM
jgi:hypothetical protein